MSEPLLLSSPAGEDLIPLSFSGSEFLCEPFSFEFMLRSPKDDLDFSTIVGEGMTLTMNLLSGEKRHIHGRVTEFHHLGLCEEGILYAAKLKPWLSLLTLSSNCRVFQNQSTPDILAAVFDEAGFNDYEFVLSGSYQPRAYCVQFMETDFNFVSRLMEDEGLFYFFVHEEGKHTMKIGDATSAFSPCPQHATVPFVPRFQESDHYGKVARCVYRESVVAGAFRLNDYNFEKPSDTLQADADGNEGIQRHYHYPGQFTEKSAGEARAKLRLEASQQPGKRLLGDSFAPGFSAGQTFTFTDHPRTALNQSYVLEKVSHQGSRTAYSNHFEAFPDTVVYRPLLKTPKARIHSSQTALVVGKSGEEIWTDSFGRIKVQFHWDLLGGKDENSSCWVRVQQGWAGTKWGAFFLPRIGQEVIVTFLEGDPDRPIVSGAIYNGEREVPYALPANQTRSTIKTISSKDGSAGNEIRFEDKKDSEEIYVHAQKDVNVEIENDRTTTLIEGSETLTIKKGDRTETIDEGSDSLTICKGDRTVEVTEGKETHKVGGTRDLTVTDNETHTNEADFTQEVTGNMTLKITGNLTIEADGDITIKAGGSLASESGTDWTSEAGASLSQTSGSDLSLEAGANLTAKGSANLEIEAGAMLSCKGSASGEVDGGASLTLKGGMVQVN